MIRRAADREKTIMRLKATVALATAVLLFGAVAPAGALAEFGFTEINSAGKPSAPAFPGEQAIWTGTCDLSSASTSNGGAGSAPAVRSHCLDFGEVPFSGGTSNPWSPGHEPSWRLDPVAGAGAHPDASAAFWFSHTAAGDPDENVHDVVVRLPPGVVGSPTAVPQCPQSKSQFIPPECPADTQVGIATLDLTTTFRTPSTHAVYNAEARHTITAEFVIGYAGGSGVNFNVPVTARGRTNGDYGVDTLALLVPTYAPLHGQAFTFWGVPWAAEHDKWRIDGVDASKLAALNVYKNGLSPADWTGYDPADPRFEDAEGNPLPIKPFFSSPTRCQPTALSVGVDVDSWQKPGALLPDESPDTSDPNWKTASIEQPLLTGCDKLHFDPSITLHPTVAVADSPSGLDVKLSTPQNEQLPFEPPSEGASPGEVDQYVEEATDYWKSDAGLATAHLKDTVVHLPAGTSFNPAAADGLQGCTTKEIGLTQTTPQVLFNNDKINCPDTSQIGTLTIHTPLLPKPLEGRVYAAPQSDNPFPGSLTSIYLVAQDEERGLSVKLAGKVDLDPATGQISTTFVDNPQLPFDDFELHFKSGSRAPLDTPTVCGQFENSVDLVPWSFPDSGPFPTIHDPFPIAAMPGGLGCVQRPQDRVFKPGFEAGTTSTQAGSHSDFVLNVTRNDGEQEVSAIALDMPPGLTATLKGVTACSDVQIAAAQAKTGLEETNSHSCPGDSYLGSVDTAAGSGSTPLHTPGRLYLAGPYQGAPLSVVTIVPAIAGGTPGNPAFDLGNVVIRTAVAIDPETALVHVRSTKVPYIVGGVPLRVRKVAVDLDRPGFMLNPTNCEQLAVGGAISGAADPLDPNDDVSAAVSDRFQVGGCDRLGFKPKLSLRLKGSTKRTGHPSLRAEVTYPRNGAYSNVKFAQVALPHSEFLDQSHIRTVCTRVQFAARECPAGSVYGHARALSPLLDYPLEGPVYLRSSNNKLPDLVAALRGPDYQPIEIDLDGRTDSIDGGLRNTFEVVPDAPVEKFVLTLQGGKKGLLVNSTNICTKAKVTHRNGRAVKRKVPANYAADALFKAQNGRELSLRPVLKVSGCAKAKRAQRHRRAKG